MVKSRVLKIKSETNSLGTTVRLVSRDGAYNEILAQYLESDPLVNNKPKLEKGYLFRSPKIKTSDWAQMLETLTRIDNNFAITASAFYKNDEEPTVIALARFEDKDDAAVFAWANVEHWQKWSDAEEIEAQQELGRKSPKLKITKDGRIVGKVTITSLGDS